MFLGGRGVVWKAMRSLHACAVLGCALLATSCASYKVPSSSFVRQHTGDQAAHYTALEHRAAQHPLYRVIPRHRQQVRWYDAPHWVSWGLWGNDDNGIFGESQRVPYSTNIHTGTCALWATRNPLHNFSFYVIGSAHWKNHYHAVLFSASGEGVRAFARGKEAVFDSDNAFKIAFNDFKPFISLQFAHFRNRRFQFYVGWRQRGNLGFKLRPWAKAQKQPPVAQEPPCPPP
jgi:hypothetical protein